MLELDRPGCTSDRARQGDVCGDGCGSVGKIIRATEGATKTFGIGPSVAATGLSYLEDQYNSTSLAAAVNNLGVVVREAVIGPDQVAGLAARNKRFARLQLSEDVMVALILLKLPEKYSTIKTMIIQSDSLPTIKALIEMLKTETDFFGGDSPAAFSGIGVRTKFCYNCDTQGHIVSECTVAKVTCGECQDKGHLAKHCWIRNDKPLPLWMSAEKKSSMLAKRAVYQAGKAGASMSAVGTEMAEWQTKFKAEDDGFLDMLAREYGSGV